MTQKQHNSVFQEFVCGRSVWLSLACSLCYGIQMLVLMTMVSALIPVSSALTGSVYQEWQFILRLERETLFYRFFVLVTIPVFAGVLTCVRKFQLDVKETFLSYVWAEVFLTAGLLCALFKTVIYDGRPQLAQFSVYAILSAALFIKACWWWVGPYVQRSLDYIVSDKSARVSRGLYIGLAVLIGLLVYMPNIEAIAARMFIGEQYHHFDSFIGAPGWAHRSGRLLNMDVMSQYGLGMPIILSELSRVFGPYGYISVLTTLMWLGILYYVGWYVLLRRWLHSSVMAAAAVMAGFRVQMFHTGTFPFVFTYPSALPVRFMFDIVFFGLLFIHLKSARVRYLLGMGLVCGIALFYMTSTGLYLTAAFFFYLVFQIVCPSLRDAVWRKDRRLWLPVCFLLPFVFDLFLKWFVMGDKIFMPEFWRNMGEFIEYFLSGWGVVPMYQSFMQQKFWASLMGFIIPWVYVVSITAAGSLIFLRRFEKRDVMVVVLSVYALGIYHYYIARSAETSYYTVGLPFIFICAFWVMKAVRCLNQKQQRSVLAAVFCLSFFALFTNHNFVSYPNIFTPSRNPMTDPKVVQLLPNGLSYFNHLFSTTQEADKVALNNLGERNERILTEKDFASDEALIQYYRQERLFPEDAALIRKLVPQGQPAALISSFEVELMMQSNRAPYFYYIPLVISRPMYMRNFPVSSLYTVNHWKRTQTQLTAQPPEYIFMERIFLTDKVPNHYLYDRPGLMTLLAFVKQYYEPYTQGKFLVAMKRKKP